MKSHAAGRAGPAYLSDIVVFGAVIPGTRLVTVREFHDYETTAQLTYDHFRFVANHKELSAVILGEALEVPPVAVSIVFHGSLMSINATMYASILFLLLDLGGMRCVSAGLR